MLPNQPDQEHHGKYEASLSLSLSHTHTHTRNSHWQLNQSFTSSTVIWFSHYYYYVHLRIVYIWQQGAILVPVSVKKTQCTEHVRLGCMPQRPLHSISWREGYIVAGAPKGKNSGLGTLSVAEKVHWWGQILVHVADSNNTAARSVSFQSIFN